MKMNINKKNIISVFLLVVIFLTVATTAYATIANRGQETANEFPVNQNGQTYGSATNAVSVETEPDLIAAIGIDGTKGYVLATDLRIGMPHSRQEAIELLESDGDKSHKISLYDIDGKTVIGEFLVTDGSSDIS